MYDDVNRSITTPCLQLPWQMHTNARTSGLRLDFTVTHRIIALIIMTMTMTKSVHAHTPAGKTHAALEALAAAPSGVYCGPLRLLACEVSDRLNARGVACSLVTGQEVKPVAGAAHAACTVEMADVGRAISVGIVDEIQMMGCVQRGEARGCPIMAVL